MFRLVGFFIACLVLMRLLQGLPGIGRWFHGLLGFWVTAIVLSLALTRLSTWLLAERRFRRRIAELDTVHSPHNRGKLGALYLAHGRLRASLEPLSEALAADPESLEWRYRRGQALLGLGRVDEAATDLAAVAEKDEEYQYGGVQLALAEACTRSGEPEAALRALERFDANHGEKPESAYRRGRALRCAGRRAEARASFARVAQLAQQGAAFQRRENAGWVARALVARWL